MTDGEVLAHDIHAVPQRDAGKKRTEIARAIVLHAADDFDAREVLPIIDAHIGKMLVVLEQDVITRLELLDEV